VDSYGNQCVRRKVAEVVAEAGAGEEGEAEEEEDAEEEAGAAGAAGAVAGAAGGAEEAEEEAEEEEEEEEEGDRGRCCKGCCRVSIGTPTRTYTSSPSDIPTSSVILSKQPC
jgi:hypothetical protein